MRELRKIVILLLGIAIIYIATDVVFRGATTFIFKNYAFGRYFKLQNSLFSNTSDILAIGSSLSEVSIDPRVLQDSLDMSCWNAGRGGQKLRYYDIVADFSLDRYTPEMVLLVIGNWDMQGVYSGDEVLQLKPLSQHDPRLRRYLYPNSPIKRFMLKSSLWANNSYVFYLLRPLLQKSVDGGNETLGMKPVVGSFHGVIDSTMAPMDSQVALNETSIADYQNLIDKFTAKDIPVVMISTPYITKPLEQTYTHQVLERIDEENDDIFYLNYWGDSRFLQSRELFHDTSHLNRKGATIFSQILAQDIRTKVLPFIKR